MKALVIIFIIISSLSALAAIGYVVVDIIIEKFRKEEEEPKVVYIPAPIPEPVPIPEPEPEPEPEPVVIEVVEEIDAEEADELLTDEVAMTGLQREPGAGTGYRGYINIGVIDQHFEAGDVVTLELLKQKKLVERKAGRVKVLADGTLSKPLVIKAESFSIQAIKMIELTGGTPIMLV